MSEKITLYTPCTGFPDLEAKIAYGLVRVGIEAGAEVEMLPHEGFYQVNFTHIIGTSSKINQVFVLLSERLLSSSRFYNLGVKARYRSIYPTVDEKGNFKERLKKVDIVSLYGEFNKSSFDFKGEKFCKHHKMPKFGSPYNKEIHSGGLILLASIHAGKPYWRNDRKNMFNLALCEVCGYLATLGQISFSFRIQMGKGSNRKYVFVLPIPQNPLKATDLLKLLSSQETLHNFWLSDTIPLSNFTLGLLAKTPTLSEFIEKIPVSFHLSLVSKDNRGDTVIEQAALTDTLVYSNFINASPYNIATIEDLLKSVPKIASLDTINKVLISKNKKNLMKFVRSYAYEMSANNNFVKLLYTETAYYLLREIGMIKKEIIENEAIGSVARTLRYFVRERKYHYADDIRNAYRNSKDFEATIVKMLREAEIRRVQEEEKRKAGKKSKFVHIPNDKEIKEVFKLANENFDEVKTTLVILAFSFPAKKEEINEIKEEG